MRERTELRWLELRAMREVELHQLRAAPPAGLAGSPLVLRWAELVEWDASPQLLVAFPELQSACDARRCAVRCPGNPSACCCSSTPSLTNAVGGCVQA